MFTKVTIANISCKRSQVYTGKNETSKTLQNVDLVKVVKPCAVLPVP